jgi:hypothetical protein
MDTSQTYTNKVDLARASPPKKYYRLSALALLLSSEVAPDSISAHPSPPKSFEGVSSSHIERVEAHPIAAPSSIESRT